MEKFSVVVVESGRLRMRTCTSHGLCYRVRHVLWRMPYAIFDLALALSVGTMGGYLLYQTDLFGRYAGVYLPMTRYADQDHWAWLFVVSGALGVAVVLWPRRPPFLLRVLARMLTAFCVLSFALNNLSNAPPPVSAFFYGVIALFAVWAVLRTRCDG